MLIRYNQLCRMTVLAFACVCGCVRLQISGLEVSLIDDRPQELLVFTLDGLAYEYHAGTTGSVQYVQNVLKVRNIQVRNAKSRLRGMLRVRALPCWIDYA